MTNYTMNDQQSHDVPEIFDTSLFSFYPEVQSTVSQPFHSTISAPRASPSATKILKREAPDSSPPLQPRVSVSPGTNSNFSTFSPAYLDPRSSSSPNAGLGVGGYSGGTTPGFDTLDELPMPDFSELPADDEIAPDTLIDVDNLKLPTQYLPSPRQTATPPTSGFTTSFHHTSSTNIKIENHSPMLSQHPHPHSPMSHNYSTASGLSSGLHPHSTTNGESVIHRSDDGTWRGGLDPDVRGEEYLPFSINQADYEQVKHEKNAEVEEWLRRSMMMLPRQRTGRVGNTLKVHGDGRRRAKSIADMRSTQQFVDGKPVGEVKIPAQNSSTIIDDDDEEALESSDDDRSEASDWTEGSLDFSEPQSPAVDEEALKKAEEDEKQRQREQDPDNLPNPRQFFSRQPWADVAPGATRGAPSHYAYQPSTANAAMFRFRQAARNIETASRVATFGSGHTRRNSAGDAERTRTLLKQLSFGRENKDKTKDGERRLSIWGNFGKGLKRTLSNAGEKEQDPTRLSTTTTVSGRQRGSSVSSTKSNSGSSSSPFAPSKLGPAFGLKLDTTGRSKPSGGIGGALASMTSPLMATGAGVQTIPTSPSGSRSGASALIDRVRRTRSKSDLQRKHMFGVVSSLVGPVMPLSAEHSPVSPGVQRKFTFGDESREKGIQNAALLSPSSAHRRNTDELFLPDHDMPDSAPVSPGHEQEHPPNYHAPHHTYSDPLPLPSPHPPIEIPQPAIIPTPEGFAHHVATLNPLLPPKLIDRISHEQQKRYRKLIEHRQKHLTHLRTTGHCPNGASKCRKQIGQVGISSPGSVTIAAKSRIATSAAKPGDDSDSDTPNAITGAAGTDGSLTTATFPANIPTPPTASLPASFECPICFKYKLFKKPSDWTKHVHEDVQPFTCTFPECNEPKSFKRKADWVRHENEKHRKLEWWDCSRWTSGASPGDCQHVCYRKDNFVQHLMREHKLEEPKPTNSKKQDAASAGVWAIVDQCHMETKRRPSEESCRFCGVTCGSWKKLSVHLAGHMEAIALPVLKLVRDDVVVPVVKNPRRQQQTVMGAVGTAQQHQSGGYQIHQNNYTTAPEPQHHHQQQMEMETYSSSAPRSAPPVASPGHDIWSLNTHQQQQQQQFYPSPHISSTTLTPNLTHTPAPSATLSAMSTPNTQFNIPTYQLTPPPPMRGHGRTVSEGMGLGQAMGGGEGYGGYGYGVEQGVYGEMAMSGVGVGMGMQGVEMMGGMNGGMGGMSSDMGGYEYEQQQQRWQS